MPISPVTLFEQIGLDVTGTVRWGTRPPHKKPGIYAISLSEDPSANEGLLGTAPVCVNTVYTWIARVPTFAYKRILKPNPQHVAEFLKTFWIDNESIVYIGKATSLSTRIGLFYNHKLGDDSPHSGGHWLKTLTVLNDLFIHYAVASTPAQALTLENEAMSVFKSQVSIHHRDRLNNPIPFANREHPKGKRKQREISKDVLR